MTIGTAWQYQANVINTDGKVKVETTKPKEGATGWSDTWMISSKAKHPNCMYKWMDYIISPKANADVTVYFGEAPGQRRGVRRGREAERRPLRAVPRQRRGLLQERLVLEHADQGLPRRRGPTSVHRLRRLDQGLDRDHGRLSRRSAEGSRAPVAVRHRDPPPRP